MWQAFRKSKKNECLRTRDVFSGYMDRRLSPEEMARAEEHLNTCQGCREELESLRATVALLRRLPEVTPSRSFALAPVKPLPGRRVLPALRFAAAGAALLLVLAFAADWTGLFEDGMLSSQQFGASTLDFGDSRTSEEGESYWVVSGEKNTVDPQSETPVDVDLVVPDSTDNVYVAVKSLTANGVVYGAVESVPDGVPQVVLLGVEEGSVHAGEVVEFAVVTASDTEYSPFATNNSKPHSTFYSIMEGQDESYLNMLSSDNNALYSFDLYEARKEVIGAKETDWLRPLEYGLIGLVAVLGAATAALWLRQRRARVTEVSENKN